MIGIYLKPIHSTKFDTEILEFITRDIILKMHYYSRSNQAIFNTFLIKSFCVLFLRRNRSNRLDGLFREQSTAPFRTDLVI